MINFQKDYDHSRPIYQNVGESLPPFSSTWLRCNLGIIMTIHNHSQPFFDMFHPCYCDKRIDKPIISKSSFWDVLLFLPSHSRKYILLWQFLGCKWYKCIHTSTGFSNKSDCHQTVHGLLSILRNNCYPVHMDYDSINSKTTTHMVLPPFLPTSQKQLVVRVWHHRATHTSASRGVRAPSAQPWSCGAPGSGHAARSWPSKPGGC